MFLHQRGGYQTLYFSFYFGGLMVSKPFHSYVASSSVVFISHSVLLQGKDVQKVDG